MAGNVIITNPMATRPHEQRWQPRQVFLFSGHMVDAPSRIPPRFPLGKEPIAARKIDETLERLGAGPEDLALSQAAAGGDLLFLEACQKRGVNCRVLLPFPEAEFIDLSIRSSAGGERWLDRFYAMKARLKTPIQVAPEELGAPPVGINPFERCNLWLLDTALACGVEKVQFVCLWNGSRGDGRGGTAQMYDEVKNRTGKTTWLDTRELW